MNFNYNDPWRSNLNYKFWLIFLKNKFNEIKILIILFYSDTVLHY